MRNEKGKGMSNIECRMLNVEVRERREIDKNGEKKVEH
jgi:hypothetical protein